MPRTRTLAAATAAAALLFAVVAPAAAAPVDVFGSTGSVCLDKSLWEYGGNSSSYFHAFTINEGSVFDTAGCTGVQLQSDAFDDFFAVWLQQGEDDVYYGDPTDLTEFVVDQTTAADGDVVVTGPVEQHFGLGVQVEHRYYVEGDLARVLVTYTNPSAAPITVTTGSDNGYGSDSTIEFLATSSGDAASATVADSWAVTSDGAASDPVLSTAWQLPAAAWTASQLTVYPWHGPVDNFVTGADLTVPAGGTVRLAYFVKMYGYAPSTILPPDNAAVVAETYVGTDLATAEAEALAGTSEWAAFSGRLVEGIPAGTVVANWGTVGGANPAVPVIVAPAFTG